MERERGHFKGQVWAERLLLRVKSSKEQLVVFDQWEMRVSREVVRSFYTVRKPLGLWSSRGGQCLFTMLGTGQPAGTLLDIPLVNTADVGVRRDELE